MKRINQRQNEMLDNKYIAHVLFLKHVDRKNYKIDKQCEVLSHREWLNLFKVKTILELE